MTAFNSQKYFELQSKAIKDRIEKFSNGRLYLEIGGQFLYDGHAQRVLPGFEPDTKVRIFKELGIEFDLIFCVNSDDIINNRIIKRNRSDFIEETIDLLTKYEQTMGLKPIVVLNKLNRLQLDFRIQNFINILSSKQYKIYKRYVIEGYPNDLETITSLKGFGFDEYIEVSKGLVLVSGVASNSGKLSTCLGQIYHESLKNIESGYAKYELFPIWNLPLHHPVNLAYEAATADIGDYNEEDKLHFEAYKIPSVNYNRDVEAFGILKKIAHSFVSESNPIREYKSPTDMGINMAGFCIEDDAAVREASITEIKRRRDEFASLLAQGKGKKEWVEKVNSLIR